MVDQVTLDRIKLMHPDLRNETEHIYSAQIVPALSGRAYCRFAYTYRTFDEQAALYAQGRTKLYDSKGNKLGKVTNSKPGQSYHNYGLAFDIVLVADGNATWDDVKDFDGDSKSDWMEVVKIMKDNGWEWGGDWKGTIVDKPHFEKRFNHNWRDLLAKYNAGQFIPGTKYVTL
jgi:peptidoglycan L-alanyl-D-glutamate endopeptidase CwlK